MNQEELTEKIYNALNGEYQERNQQVEVIDCESGDRTWETRITSCSRHFPKKTGWGAHLGREELEALVLIPEEMGAAEVKRVYHSGGAVKGFYTPEYTEEALEAIFAAYAKKFSEPGKLTDKYSLIFSPHAVIPKEMSRFQNHKDKITAGINNSEYRGHRFRHDDEEVHDVLSIRLEQMGFSGAKDTGLVQALWSKSKESTSGFLRGFSWNVFADYLLEHNPEIVTEFDYIRQGLSRRSLSNLLISIPVNPGAETNDWDRKRRGMPEEKIWRPILEFVDKAIMESKE